MLERYCLDVMSPAGGFMDSFLLGNGRLGATLRSGVGEERIDINLDRFWSGGPMGGQDGPSPAALLADLRQAIRQGDSESADDLSVLMQGEGWTQSYQPMAALLWRFDGIGLPGRVTNYRRRLDLSTATAEHSYGHDGGDVRVTSFVSGAHDVSVAFATGEGLLSPSKMDLCWECKHPSQSHEWTDGTLRWLRIEGRAPAEVIPLYVQSDAPVRYDHAPVATDGTVKAGMGFCVMAVLAPLASGGAKLLIAAECGFRGAFERPSADVGAMAALAEARLRAALALDLADLHAASIADYRQYFGRNDLELAPCPDAGIDDPAKAELLYHFGRYLLIASSRQKTEPPNLQGIWNPYLRPAWSSNHTTNINTEMNYWLAEPTGLGDLAEPFMDMVAELVKAGRGSARHFYGAPGSVLHHNTDVWRFTQPVHGTPVWANWTSALPWLLAQCWDHWEYGSGDDDFARNQLLPMLAEVSKFALFMLVEDESGALVVSPSSSPEHPFLDSMGEPRGVTEGAALDQQLYAQLLGRLVALSRHFGVEDDLTARAEQALRRLRGIDVGRDGAVKEWAGKVAGAEPGHRHLSHLYAVYPGGGLAAGPAQETITAFRLALEDRLRNGTGHTGWSQSWVLCLAARFGEAALAQSAITHLLSDLTTRSLLVLHPFEGAPDNAVFQIDGNFGATAGILELIVQSHSGMTILLSALPKGWARGRLSGAVVRGGHKVDVRWEDGALREARIAARKDDVLTLDIPLGKSYQVTRASDGLPVAAPLSLHARPGRQQMNWQIASGETYMVSSALPDERSDLVRG